jgi:hypothetical protein
LPPGEFDVYLDPSAPGITGNAQRALCPKGHTEQDGDCSSTCFVPHEHRWSKPHDCGDPACEATGRVICLTGDSRCIPPGADPHE